VAIVCNWHTGKNHTGIAGPCAHWFRCGFGYYYLQIFQKQVMASFTTYFPKLIKHEGGFVMHPNDPGGATNKGITIANWKAYGRDVDKDGDIDVNDLKFISVDDAKRFYKTHFWDKLKADQISNQAIAETFVDHGVNAGIGRAARMMQYILKVPIDGIVGSNTINAINSFNPTTLLQRFNSMRGAYYTYRGNAKSRDTTFDAFFKTLGVTPSNTAAVFVKGWLNRLSAFGPVAKTATKIGGILVAVAIAVILYNSRK
jgi:hypothetical protein